MQDFEHLVGKTLGAYVIQGELGRGGMGVVYQAAEQSLQRVVALKVLPGHLAQDPSFVKRFLREARAAAQLSHPNIVHIYAVGEHRGLYYMAMEYVKGRPLSDLIQQRGRLDPRWALNITGQAAAALAEAHAQGIVHRDIKPHNIMIDQAGRVRVMDFGLAKVLLASTHLTAEGAKLGTPMYMSPEQTEGGALDARTDLYSLGVTLFEMLAGRPPYEPATPLSLMYQIVHQPFPDLRALNAGISPELAGLVARMTAKRPEERIRSAQEVAAEARRLLRKPNGAAFSGVPQQTAAAAAAHDSPTTALETGVTRMAPAAQGYGVWLPVLLGGLLGLALLWARNPWPAPLAAISAALVYFDARRRQFPRGERRKWTLVTLSPLYLFAVPTYLFRRAKHPGDCALPLLRLRGRRWLGKIAVCLGAAAACLLMLELEERIDERQQRHSMPAALRDLDFGALEDEDIEDAPPREAPNNPEPAAATGRAFPLGEYFPLNKGDQWTFDAVNRPEAGQIAARTVQVDQYPRGMRWKQQLGDAAFSGYGTGQGLAIDRFLDVAFDPPVRWLRNPAHVGDVLRTQTEMRADGEERDFLVRSVVEGVEPLDAPGGELRHCLRVALYAVEQDDDAPSAKLLVRDWLAPGWGVVKREIVHPEHARGIYGLAHAEVGERKWPKDGAKPQPPPFAPRRLPVRLKPGDARPRR